MVARSSKELSIANILGSRSWSWIPFLGVLDLADDVVNEFNLDPAHQWRAFALDWFNFGFIFVIWPVTE